MKIIMKIILGKADYHKNYHEHYPVKLSWAKQIVIEIIMKLTVKMMTMTKMTMLDDDSKYLSSTNCCEKSTSSCKGEEKHLFIILMRWIILIMWIILGDYPYDMDYPW